MRFGLREVDQGQQVLDWRQRMRAAVELTSDLIVSFDMNGNTVCVFIKQSFNKIKTLLQLYSNNTYLQINYSTEKLHIWGNALLLGRQP